MKDKKVIFLILVSFVLFVVCLIKSTYAFYEDSNSISILSSKVGDFASGSITGTFEKTTDINVLIMLQDHSDENKYNISNVVPVFGYTLNQEKSNCYPEDANYGEPIYKIEGNKVTIKVQENKPTQVVCRIIYDINKHSDVTVYALLQDDTWGTKEYNKKKYRFTNIMPSDNTYNYIGYECVNPITNFDYIKGTGFKFSSDSSNVCYAYFNKAS